MSQSNLHLKKTADKPNAFLDFVIQTLGLKNDAALARRIELTNAAICRVRSGGPISDDMMLMVHDEAPDVLTIAKLQELRGSAVSTHARTPTNRLSQQSANA